jgi:CRP-like cAMP-binding protein
MPAIDAADLSVLFRELELRDQLRDDERQVLINAVDEVRSIPGHTDIIRQGDRPTRSILLLSGMVTRYAELPDGKRQITALHVPGDFVDLHSFPLKIMDHSVATVTASRIALFTHAAIERITETMPHLTRMLWMLTLIDGSRHRQWIAAMGTLPAVQRTAHLICELGLRMTRDGTNPPQSLRLPITQIEFAETLGLSAVHTNRTIKTLKARGLISWSRDEVRILDWDGLVKLGDFDPTFLHYEKVRR